MKNCSRVAIIGATGAVGQELLRLLEQRHFPLKKLRCFASPASKGKKILFKNQVIEIEMLHPKVFQEIDLAFFCAGKKVSLEFIPIAVAQGTLVIDHSSAYRMDPNVPLVIPEINPQALKTHRGIIASPNCTTTIMLLPLAPLHKHFQIDRIVAATYQAASGAGYQAMQELKEETEAVLDNKPFTRKIFPFPYAFNLFTHNSPMLEHGYAEEEMKMVHETRKILNDSSIRVTATCVRVPVLRAHSITMNVSFKQSIHQNEIYSLIKSAPGVTILEDWKQNRFPMPSDATEQELVFCGRIRQDQTQDNTIELFAVGDQLLKGAALNGIQIAEALYEIGKT